MENASRMLMMAATLLLGILIITLFVRLFGAGAKIGENYDAKQQFEQLELYNSKFEVYNKPNNTISDIVSVLNLAYSINDDCEYDAGNTVEILIETDGTDYLIPKNIKIDRNKVKPSNSSNLISIYDLLNKNLTELGIGSSDDTLLLTEYIDKNNTGRKMTIYKYLFNCLEIKYENNFGKVSFLKFKMYQNPDY